MVHAAHQRELVHDLRDLREMFPHLNSRHGGRDLSVFAAHFGRRQRLGVIRLELAGTAVGKQQDARTDRARRSLGRRGQQPGAGRAKEYRKRGQRQELPQRLSARDSSQCLRRFSSRDEILHRRPPRMAVETGARLLQNAVHGGRCQQLRHVVHSRERVDYV
jgi:hypothetical protein